MNALNHKVSEALKLAKEAFLKMADEGKEMDAKKSKLDNHGCCAKGERGYHLGNKCSFGD